MPPPALPLFVQTFVLARENGRVRVLLARRAGLQGPGWFGFGGRVTPGERLSAAAARFLMQQAGMVETGVVHQVPGYIHRFPVPPGDRELYASETRLLAEYAFWAVAPPPSPDEAAPHASPSLRWFGVDHALSTLTYAMHARAVRLAVAALQAVLAGADATDPALRSPPPTAGGGGARSHTPGTPPGP